MHWRPGPFCCRLDLMLFGLIIDVTSAFYWNYSVLHGAELLCPLCFFLLKQEHKRYTHRQHIIFFLFHSIRFFHLSWKHIDCEYSILITTTKPDCTGQTPAIYSLCTNSSTFSICFQAYIYFLWHKFPPRVLSEVPKHVLFGGLCYFLFIQIVERRKGIV